MSTVFSLISTQTTFFRLEVFLEENKLSETCPITRQTSLDPSIFHQSSMRFSCLNSKLVCSFGDVNVFQWNREWFFSRRVKLDSWFNVMAVYEVYWHGPKIINCWFSKKIKVTFLIELVAAVSKWKFSSFDLLQGVWFVHLRLENKLSFFLWEISPLSHWVFSNRFPMRPSSPTPQGLQPVRHPSKFLPRTKRIRWTIQGKTFFPNCWILHWSFAVVVWYSTSEPSGIIGPFDGCPKRLS